MPVSVRRTVSGMWIVELAFTAGTDAAARLAARPAHRERVAALHAEGVVAMAGPFADDSGALLVFDVPTRADLDALLAADPYFRVPGVTVTAARQWRPFVGGPTA